MRWVGLALAGVALAVSGCGAIGSGTPVSELWASNCQRCHGEDGRGVPALRGIDPALDLSRSRMVSKGDRTEVRRVIAVGDLSMPGFGHRLPNGDVNALVDFVLQMSREEVR